MESCEARRRTSSQAPAPALGAQEQDVGDVLRPGAVQVAQRIARRGEVAVLERELGATHEARRLQRIAGAIGALEPAVAAVEIAHLVRRSRGQKRRYAGGSAALERDPGLLFRARVAPFVIGLQRRGERRVRPLAPAGAGAMRAPWQGETAVRAGEMQYGAPQTRPAAEAAKKTIDISTRHRG